MGVVVTLAGKQMMTGGAQKVDPRVPSSHARHGSPSHWWMPPKRRCRPGPSVFVMDEAVMVVMLSRGLLWHKTASKNSREASSTRCMASDSLVDAWTTHASFSFLLVSYRTLAPLGFDFAGRRAVRASKGNRGRVSIALRTSLRRGARQRSPRSRVVPQPSWASSQRCLDGDAARDD